MGEYTSLCYVSEKDGKKTLCRIADYGDGFYYPNDYDYTAPKPALFDDTNRDLIFGSQRSIAHEDGDIGLYTWHSEWNSVNNRWDTKIDDVPTSIPWIEVFKTHCHTLREVITNIRNGYQIHSRYDKNHDCIFWFDDIGENAIYVSARQLKERDGKLFFKDDVQAVLKGSINQRDVRSCECRYSAYTAESERFYFRRTSKWDPKNTIGIKDPNELINDIIRAKLKNALSRNDRQAGLRALDKVDSGSVSEQLAQTLDCPEDEAKKYVTDYFSSRKARLDENESIKLIEAILSADSVLVDRLREQVDKEWRNAHTQLLKKFDDEISEQQRRLDSTTKAVQEEDAYLQHLIEEQNEAENAAKKATILQHDVEVQIERRLSEMKENQAQALVDTAFTRINSGLAPSTQAISHLPQPTIIRPDGEKVDEIGYDDAFQDAVDFSLPFCVDKSSASELALFILASYVCNQPLIVAGEQSEILANLIATYCTGLPCTTVIMKESDTSDSIIAALSQDVPEYICITDAFERNYEKARKVMDAFPGTRFIFTVRHPESLLMEPRSIFNTFLPVLTEFFFVDTVPSVPTGFSCKGALHSIRLNPSDINRARAYQSFWFDGVYVSPQLRTRCAKLQAALDSISRAVTSNIEVAKNSLAMVAIVPLLHYIGNSEGINLLLNSLSQLDPERKQMVKLYAGL